MAKVRYLSWKGKNIFSYSAILRSSRTVVKRENSESALISTHENWPIRARYFVLALNPKNLISLIRDIFLELKFNLKMLIQFGMDFGTYIFIRNI